MNWFKDVKDPWVYFPAVVMVLLMSMLLIECVAQQGLGQDLVNSTMFKGLVTLLFIDLLVLVVGAYGLSKRHHKELREQWEASERSSP